MPEDRKAAFVKLLQNKVIIDNRPVPILTQWYPDDVFPAITLTQQSFGGVNDRGEFFNYEEDVIDSKTNITGYRSLISLHIWASNVDERDNIYNQVIALLNDAMDWQYNQCFKYNPVNHQCSETNQECDARTHTNAYSLNGRCPYPKPSDENYRAPETILHHFNIDNQIEPRNPDFQEDLTLRPEAYKVILDIEFNYFDVRTRRVARTDSVTYEETIEE